MLHITSTRTHNYTPVSYGLFADPSTDYLGPYNKTLWGSDPKTGWNAGSGPNLFPHVAFLSLSSYFIKWYKLPAGSPPPPISAADEAVFYFYNLQSVNNSCPLDPVGPLSKITSDDAYPLEDAVYVTALLASDASISIRSGAAAPRTFTVSAGVVSVQAPALPGPQRITVERGGNVLVDVVGSEAINTTAQSAAICNSQTFSGTARLQPTVYASEPAAAAEGAAPVPDSEVQAARHGGAATIVTAQDYALPPAHYRRPVL